ncbi:MAG: lipoate--protein ligase family protein [Anaerolineae bacterium]|nr:lipoate--protein ligase family protein [Anaerolineae bacterium]
MTAPTARPIRHLPFSAEAAPLQLAASLALLAGVEAGGLPVMRWYGMDPPALILGSSQQPEQVDPVARRTLGVHVYRRSSGGGAVLTTEQLGLDIALPANDPLLPTDITASYRWLGEVWVAALAGLGIEGRMVSVAEARADVQALSPTLRRICYAGLSPYEVVAGGRKLVGLAQRRRRGGALYQCGVYLRWSPDATAALMRADEASALVIQELAARVVGLDMVATPPVPTAARISAAFAAALTAHTGLTPAPSDWTVTETATRVQFAETIPALL